MSLADHLRALRGSTAVARVVGSDDTVEFKGASVEDPGSPVDDQNASGQHDVADTDAKATATQPPAVAAVPPAEAPKAADPAEVAAYCHANGAGALTADFIRDKATMDQVKARVGAVETIRALVKDASLIAPTITASVADEYIAASMSVEDVRTKLWDRVVKAQSPEVRGAISADTGADDSKTAMNKAVDKVNARISPMQPKEG